MSYTYLLVLSILCFGQAFGQYALDNACDQVVYQMEGTRLNVDTSSGTTTETCASLCFSTANCIRYKFADITPTVCDLYSAVTSIRVPRATRYYGTPGNDNAISVRGAIGGTIMSTTGVYFFASECDALCAGTTGCVAYVYTAANLWTQGELRGTCTMYSAMPTPNMWVVYTGPSSCGEP